MMKHSLPHPKEGENIYNKWKRRESGNGSQTIENKGEFALPVFAEMRRERERREWELINNFMGLTAPGAVSGTAGNSAGNGNRELDFENRKRERNRSVPIFARVRCANFTRWGVSTAR